MVHKHPVAVVSGDNPLKFIFLDDDRVPSDVTWTTLPKTPATIVRNLHELQAAFVSYIQDPSIDLVIVSFDHDLQIFNDGKETKGQDCVWWLINYMMDHNISSNRVHCLFHTKNVIGKENMESLWKNFLKRSK